MFNIDDVLGDTLPSYTLIGERNDKPHYRSIGAVSVVKKPKPASNVALFTRADLKPGRICPKCLGLPQYIFMDGRQGKCHVCNGNRVLSVDDKMYIDKRLGEGRDICWIVTKPGQLAA